MLQMIASLSGKYVTVPMYTRISIREGDKKIDKLKGERDAICVHVLKRERVRCSVCVPPQ